MGNECEWALPTFCSVSVERAPAAAAPVAIDDVDSFGRHRRLHEHFPRIISGRTTEEGSGEGERDGLNTQRHLNARRTESARTYSGTRIGAQPLNMKRRYL